MAENKNTNENALDESELDEVSGGLKLTKTVDDRDTNPDSKLIRVLRGKKSVKDKRIKPGTKLFTEIDKDAKMPLSKACRNNPNKCKV